MPSPQRTNNANTTNHCDSDGPDPYQDEADDVVPDLPSQNHGQRAGHWHHIGIHTYCTDEHCRHDDVAHIIRPTDAMSIFSSKTETASNRTGAGRGLGQVYSALGWRLELSLGRAAHKMGFGPRAAAETVWLRYMRWMRAPKRQLDQAVRVLLKYLSYAFNPVRICSSH